MYKGKSCLFSFHAYEKNARRTIFELSGIRLEKQMGGNEIVRWMSSKLHLCGREISAIITKDIRRANNECENRQSMSVK